MSNYTSTDLVSDTEALFDRVRTAESLDLAETVGELIALVRLQSQFIHQLTGVVSEAPSDGPDGQPTADNNGGPSA